MGEPIIGDGDVRRLQEIVESMRENAVATLQNLVRTPSVTGQEADIGKMVADFCRELGLEVEVIEAEAGRPNVIARWRGSEPGPNLLLNDHLDIVPPGPIEYWTHPPFGAEIANGRIYGRGAIDTKSGLTTILMATKAARQLDLPLRGTLTLVFSCDEEAGGTLGMQYLGRSGYLDADMAVVAEPTTMQVEIATKGRLNLQITTRGIATHGARPWLGHNAIEDMADVVVALRELARKLETRHHPLLGSPSLCVGRIDGGTIPNMVPSKCILGLDRRLLPEEDPDEVQAEIQAVLDRLAVDNPRFSGSLERLLWWPGYVISEDEPIVQIASGAFRTVTGNLPQIAGKDAGTDASWINVLGGIPVVMFSPGNGFEAMNADESVSIEDFITATKVIAQIIYDVLFVASDTSGVSR